MYDTATTSCARQAGGCAKTSAAGGGARSALCPPRVCCCLRRLLQAAGMVVGPGQTARAGRIRRDAAAAGRGRLRAGGRQSPLPRRRRSPRSASGSEGRERREERRDRRVRTCYEQEVEDKMKKRILSILLHLLHGADACCPTACLCGRRVEAYALPLGHGRPVRTPPGARRGLRLYAADRGCRRRRPAAMCAKSANLEDGGADPAGPAGSIRRCDCQ